MTRTLQRFGGAALALVALGVLTAPACAQSSLFFDDYCVTGSFQVCASVRLVSTGNTLTMQVWNLDGMIGSQHTITSVGVYHSNNPWSGNVDSYGVNYWQSGSSSTDITSAWTQQGGTDISTLGGVGAEIYSGTGGNAGIIGCDDPGGNDKWATCNSFAGPPYVEFTFNLSTPFDLNTGDTQIRWHSTQLLDGSSLKCDTGGNGDYGPCSAVPEPSSVLLLATGLLGILGFGYVKRRKALPPPERPV